MVMVPSTMMDLGTEAPDFSLPDAEGRTVALGDLAEAPALLVMFICNHCPFVQHVRAELAILTSEFMEKGVAVVGINSNDVEKHPDDSPEKMREEQSEFGYRFPYLFDETQEVAKAYRAACTPDFYVFDAERRLVYRGQMDDSRPKTDIPVTGTDLRAAVEAVLAGSTPSTEQKPSVGCNIKWKPGGEPGWFPTG